MIYNYIILGANSYIGKEIYNYLRSLGHNVIGTYANKAEVDLLYFNVLKSKLNCFCNDINTSRKTFVVICFGITKIDECYTYKELSYNINVVKTKELLLEIYKFNYVPIFFSSEAVFSGEGKLNGYTEESETDSICEYGKQKVEIERFIKERFTEFLIFRIGVAISKQSNKKNLLNSMYSDILEKGKIICLKDRCFSPINVEDIAKAIDLASAKELSGLYHIASKEKYKREEIAKVLLNLLDIKASIEIKEKNDFNFKDERAVNTVMNGDKLAKSIVFQYKGIEETIREFVSNINGRGNG